MKTVPIPNPKPQVGRGPFAQDQKIQIMADKRTKRLKTRAAQKRRALREQ